jgi:hypothetical protein
LKEALQSHPASAATWVHPSPQYIALAQALVHVPALKRLLQEKGRDKLLAAELPLLKQLLCIRETDSVSDSLERFQPELKKCAHASRSTT